MINPLEFSEREEVISMSFIEIKGLSKIFLQGNQKIYGIRNANLSIEKGTFMSVIGRSGSGKPTFLNLVGGIENPTSGEVFFDGKSIHQFKDKELTKFRNQHIGYVFQQYHLLKELTVLENIRLPLDIGRKAYDHSYEEELLDLLGLPRSHKITLSLPPAIMYSADISHSSIVADKPRFSKIGLSVLPSSFKSSKFCILRAPT